MTMLMPQTSDPRLEEQRKKIDDFYRQLSIPDEVDRYRLLKSATTDEEVTPNDKGGYRTLRIATTTLG